MVYEHWNPPSMLAPVGCPLVILVDGKAVRCERVDHVADKADNFKYQLADGTVIVGRHRWSYP